MKVETFRKIDFFLGIPACFLLSLISNLKRLLSTNRNITVQPENILFLQLSETGALILAYPAIKKVKEKYPNANIYLLIFKESSEFTKHLGIIPRENIILMRSANFWTLLVDFFRNIKRIKEYKIDTVIDLELFSRFSSVLSYLSGAKNKAGFYRYTLEGLYRGNLHTHKVSYNSYAHISKNFISLVDSLDASLDNLPLLKSPNGVEDCSLPKISISDQGRQNIWNKLKSGNDLINQNSKIIVINIYLDDKVVIRQWPVGNYLDLIRRLLEDTDAFIVLVGGGVGNVASIFPKHKRCIDLIGKTIFHELVDLFNISDILISSDGRIVHLAALTDIYIIAFFGPETPQLYGPLTKNKMIFYKRYFCSPCLSAYNYKNSICRDNQCMKAITVDEVHKAVMGIIVR